MIWVQVVLLLIFRLAVTFTQNVQAEEPFILKGNNSGISIDSGSLDTDDNFLYTQFACRGKPNGLRIPIPGGNCVNYYECLGGAVRRASCKAGLHFSNHALACIDVRLSKCNPDQMIASANCEGLCCTRDDGLYPAKDSCSEFLVCLNGQTFRKRCRGSLQFSADNLICDIPERARCNSFNSLIDNDIIKPEKLAPPGTPSKPVMYMVSNRVCRNQRDGESLPIFGSCNKFYLCAGEVGYLKSCGNLQFNPKKRFCDARTRIYCPEVEQDDVILNEVEYVPVSIGPMPLPRPTPQDSLMNLIPLHVNGEERENEDEEDKESKPPTNKHPQNGKNPIKGDKQSVKERPFRPRPGPPIIEDEEKEHLEWNSLGKKPVIEQNKIDEDPILRPNKRPQAGKPVPIPPFSENIPLPPHINLTNKEQENEDDVEEATSICANQPVGALLAMPRDCSKYIRCRWDWYKRRVAEVMICPQEMHFNPKSKYCDSPENAGCKANLSKPNEISKKKNYKFSSSLN